MRCRPHRRAACSLGAAGADRERRLASLDFEIEARVRWDVRRAGLQVRCRCQRVNGGQQSYRRRAGSSTAKRTNRTSKASTRLMCGGGGVGSDVQLHARALVVVLTVVVVVCVRCGPGSGGSYRLALGLVAWHSCASSRESLSLGRSVSTIDTEGSFWRASRACT
jgi:hypothetical protein